MLFLREPDVEGNLAIGQLGDVLASFGQVGDSIATLLVVETLVKGATGKRIVHANIGIALKSRLPDLLRLSLIDFAQLSQLSNGMLIVLV